MQICKAFIDSPVADIGLPFPAITFTSFVLLVRVLDTKLGKTRNDDRHHVGCYHELSQALDFIDIPEVRIYVLIVLEHLSLIFVQVFLNYRDVFLYDFFNIAMKLAIIDVCNSILEDWGIIVFELEVLQVVCVSWAFATCGDKDFGVVIPFLEFVYF